MSGEKIELPNNLSLRDYFAAAALQGGLQYEMAKIWQAFSNGATSGILSQMSHISPQLTANSAYAFADAMLAAREANLSQQAVSEEEIAHMVWDWMSIVPWRQMPIEDIGMGIARALLKKFNITKKE